MKAYGGSGCIDQHFLDLGTSWRWVVSFTPRPLYPRGKRPRYPFDRRLGGLQSRSGRCGGKKFLTLPGLEFRPLGRPARSQSLYRLRYPSYFRYYCYFPRVTEEIHEVSTATFRTERSWIRIYITHWAVTSDSRTKAWYSLATYCGDPKCEQIHSPVALQMRSSNSEWVECPS
jgi:hypothetical protein